jgi:hypothetical protein
MRETKEKKQEPTNKELLHLERQSDPMSSSRLPSVVPDTFFRQFAREVVQYIKRLIVVSLSPRR